ncbi:MAG: ABC transporter permease [Candidatus Aminicenantes bacterium]|nr:ABC transporter permease [Candidatus Aminicenantes bacterium]
MSRTNAVFKKEFLHILRDPASLTIVLIMPVMMILIFGHALTFDIDNVETGVFNTSNGDLSRSLIETFSCSTAFRTVDLSHFPKPLEEAERLIKAGRLKQVLIVPPDFDRKLKQNRKSQVGFIIDGNDSNIANRVYQYDEMAILSFTAEQRNMEGLINIHTQMYFNPANKSSFFFIPGIIAILLLMISALLTSLSMAREKESGSIDLIFISPLKSAQIIMGKTIPYIFVALADGVIILLCARFLFSIPIKGNLLVLLIFSLLYILSGLSLGILVSTVAPNQMTAMFVAILATLLPSILLSGFIFPLDSMAPVLRFISQLVPATYFIEIIRGVIIKGAELKHFFKEGLALLFFSMVLLAASMGKFQQSRKKKK